MKRVIRSVDDWNKITKRVSADLGKTPFTIELSSNVKKRSNQQNRYYWGVVIEEAYRFYSNNLNAFIRDALDAMKFRITKEFVHELLKMHFNEGRSTTRRSTTAMAEYCEEVRAHFATEHGIDIAPPTPSDPLCDKAHHTDDLSFQDAGAGRHSG